MTERPSASSEPLPRTGWRDVLGFLAFSHGWTWLFWAIAGLWGASVWDMPAVILFFIGGAGVFFGGVIMSRLTYGPGGLRELGGRIVDPGRIGARWWAVIVLLFPVLVVLSAGVAMAMGMTTTPIDLGGAFERLLYPGQFLLFALFILIVGPLPEEIGWRGYLLDRLQLRWNALTASLALALVWWMWHLPLFVLPGYFDAFGRATPHPLDFLYGLVPAAILYTWVYNNTDRSVQAVIVLHFMQNFTSEVLGVAEEMRSVLMILTIAVAVAVVLWWGPRSLRRGRAIPKPPAWNEGDRVSPRRKM